MYSPYTNSEKFVNNDYKCQSFCYFYTTAENRKILHEQEAEKMLIHLLSHESTDVQTAAAQALGIMSENLLSKDSIREWGNLLKIKLSFAMLYKLANSHQSSILKNKGISHCHGGDLHSCSVYPLYR